MNYHALRESSSREDQKNRIFFFHKSLLKLMKNTWLKGFFKIRSRYKVTGVKWSTCSERVGSCRHRATLLATMFRKNQY